MTDIDNNDDDASDWHVRQHKLALRGAELVGRGKGWVFTFRLLWALLLGQIFMEWQSRVPFSSNAAAWLAIALTVPFLIVVERHAVSIEWEEKYWRLRSAGQKLIDKQNEIIGVLSVDPETGGSSSHFSGIPKRLEALEAEKQDLQDALSRAAGGANAPPRRRGRPQGSGGFAAQDAPLVAKMREMILATPGLTPFGAAGQFAGEAVGTGEFEAKQRRLAALYRKTYPD